MPRPSARVTLGDVAAAAGVSKMTVSRALGHGWRARMRPDTRARIVEIAERMGYERDALASGLTSGRTGIVAILVPDLGNAVFSELIAGIQEELPADLQTIVARTGFEPGPEHEALRRLLGWRPDAVVLAGPARSPETAALLRARGTPTVEAMDLPDAPIDMAVGFRHADAGALAAEHLRARGYARAAVLGAGPEDLRARQRADAFAARFEALGGTPPVLLPGDGASSFEAGMTLCARVLAEAPDRDCLFAVNDLLATGARLHAQATGHDVPGRLAICGFNDLPITAALLGGITTVRSPRREIGQACARLILARLSAAPAPSRVQVGCTIVQRATT